MPTQDTTRRLRPQIINQDITSFHGLQTISTYDTTRADASAKTYSKLIRRCWRSNKPKPRN
jgi:hypothetical protein